MPIPKMSTLDFFRVIAEILFPDALFPEKHMVVGFTLLTLATIIYYYLMLDDFHVDNWRTVLKLTAFWFIAEILGSGVVINLIRISVREEGPVSKILLLGLLTISAAYIAISVGAWWVRDRWLVRGIATFIAIVGVCDCILWTHILIRGGVIGVRF